MSEDIPSGMLGVAFVDAATGHFHVGQCVDDAQHSCLRTLLAQLRPDEILVDEARLSRGAYTLLRRAVCARDPAPRTAHCAPRTAHPAPRTQVPEGLFNSLPAKSFWHSRAAAEKALADGGYFRSADGTDTGWPDALCKAAEATPVALGLAAFGGCASYLKRLLLDQQLLSMRHMSTWTPTDGDGGAGGGASLVLDSKALDNLEIFENSSDRSSRGTLFAILDRCASPFGKRTLRRWLCAPPRDVCDITERQESVGALMGHTELCAGLSKTLRKLPDLERLLARVHTFSVAQSANNATHYTDVGRARLAELIKTLEGFEALQAAVTHAQPEASELADAAPALAAALTVGDGFPDLRELLGAFRSAFDWAQAKAEGRVIPSRGVDDVYDGAADAVKAAKAGIDAICRQWQHELADRSIELWSAAGSPTEPFQLAVSEETLKRRGTPAEFTQMSSKKGTKRFWTPDLKGAVGAYLSAKEALDAALASSARRLYARFSSHFAYWHRAVSVAADLDCLMSLAAVSGAPGMCRPAFTPAGPDVAPFLRIRGGVNICVQAALGGAGQCIPNDISIGHPPADADNADNDNDNAEAPLMLLVTGPNMGGKSTLLRQACLTALMAHLGCHVPARACALTPVDRIFTRVGANDAIMAGLSTFRVELEETAAILQHATKDSIVILDELGRGTATFDGMAIAHAVLGHLIGHTACRSLFATHYHALTREFEAPNGRVALYHMACAVDEASRAVTFLYTFARGACHRSHGVNVARLAGLPEGVLELAAAKSSELEAALEERYAIQLARGLLAAAQAAQADADGSAAALRSLWHEVGTACRL